MTYIKTQKIVRDSDGNIISGSASVCESVYDRNAGGHSKGTTIERLGKVIYLAEGNKQGVFLSPTRGLVSYDARLNRFEAVASGDPRLGGRDDLFPEPEIHTVMGDAYMMLSFMKKDGILSVLRKAFPDEGAYQRVLCHVLHTVLRLGSRKNCRDFFEQSFFSYLADKVPAGTLASDSAYFAMMGKVKARTAFFKAYVEETRKKNPGFGKSTYVDSTPLPNDVQRLFSNAFCSHGTGSSASQTRLALVLDDATGLPLWHSFLPGNVPDLGTVAQVSADVAETLDIDVGGYILDAGYLTRKLLECFFGDGDKENGTSLKGKRITAKMPAKKGYPHRQLYNEPRPGFLDAGRQFDREGHTYFGAMKRTEIFKMPVCAYVFLDFENAHSGARDYREAHREEYDAMTPEEKDYVSYKSGFFVIVDRDEKSPEEELRDYFSRTGIETYFKTAKDFTGLLPLAKWTPETVRGKVLNDIISAIVFRKMQAKINSGGKSATRLIGKTQAMMCLRKKDGHILPETAGKNVKELYKAMDLKIPGITTVKALKEEFLMK